ncbi:MAG: Lrp/AsnC family transcriptional regulator [Selenomonadaceae bacterium]|nr:Lrp/AsnC family transcriptional regulator [Selenomonadaceae bacterium]
MDDTDKRILKKLQQNARVTLSELAGDVSLSVPAVSERLKKLEQSGVIRQYTAILNPQELGKELVAHIFLRFDTPKNSDRFAELVKNEGEVTACYYITGDFDYLIKVVTENTTTLARLLARIKNFPGVVKTQTIIVLSTISEKPSILPE